MAAPLLLRRTAPFLVAAAVFAAGVAVAWSVRGGAAPPHVFAATAVVDESFAACTAPMDENVEGVFLLDFETGDLTGYVLGRATAKFNVSYRRNVLKDLEFKAGKVKSPRFLLTTGLADFAGNAGMNMARSVLYVTDPTTGVTAAYAMPWNAQQAGAGPAVVEFTPLDRVSPRGGKPK